MADTKCHDAIELPFASTLRVELSAQARVVEERVLTLFDTLAPSLRRYVRSFGLDYAITEEVVQDVFLALFRHLSLGRPDTNLPAWLFQVAHNLALKQRQRAARRCLVEDAWNPLAIEQVRDGALNPEEQLSSGRKQRYLAAVLRRMSARDRQCIHLRAEGLCYRDIAATLGISLGSVAKSVVRALASLSTANQEYDHGA